MKHFIYCCTVLLLTLTAGSCGKKFLNVIPKDQLTDAVFWKNENDADLALTGLYRGWEDYRNVHIWMDMMSDIAYSKFPTPIQVMGNGQMNAVNPGLNLFVFNQNRKYNNFLEKVETIEMDNAKKERYKAEVRFLRAYDTWRRAQYYGDFPVITSLIENPEEAKLPRTAYDQVISFVLSELEAIIPTLPVQNMRESGGRVTRGAALALKARCELYEGLYPQAMASAKAVMDMPVYELFPDYGQLFDIDSENLNKESILEIFYVENDYTNLLWVDVTGGNDGGGYGVVCPTDNMVSMYEMANGKPITDPGSGYDPDQPFTGRDPRFYMTILHPGMWYNGRYWTPYVDGTIDHYLNAVSFRSGYGFRKFAKLVNPSIVDNCGQNIMVFRLAEMYLTYAEAAIESNQLTNEMYDAIDAVRTRAGMPPVDRAEYDTQEELRELIRRERTVELAFEGLRYHDVRRWDLGPQVLDGNLYGARLGTVDPGTGQLTLAPERIFIEQRNFHPERQYLLPIPQSVLDANPNISQNPGY